ncbi:MAG TPA: hypothetical protein VFU36_02985, partial [Jatrophihabitans sp.]|nr:hypothetical protein [Jatrophihabitans sp.]
MPADTVPPARQGPGPEPNVTGRTAVGPAGRHGRTGRHGRMSGMRELREVADGVLVATSRRYATTSTVV